MKRKLGKNSLEVSFIGLGCMGMSHNYGASGEQYPTNMMQREIAGILDLSKRTVEYYLENIKNKTRSANKSELIEKVFEMF